MSVNEVIEMQRALVGSSLNIPIQCVLKGKRMSIGFAFTKGALGVGSGPLSEQPPGAMASCPTDPSSTLDPPLPELVPPTLPPGPVVSPPLPVVPLTSPPLPLPAVPLPLPPLPLGPVELPLPGPTPGPLVSLPQAARKRKPIIQA